MPGTIPVDGTAPIRLSLTSNEHELRLIGRYFPYQVVSLREMFNQIRVDLIFKLGSFITTVREIVDKFPSDLIPHDDIFESKIATRLEKAKELAANGGFKMSCLQIDRIVNSIRGGNCTGSELSASLKELELRLGDELNTEVFVHFPSAMANLYSDASPLGEDGRKLDTRTNDIEEAAKCLAVGRATASVMHMMRVMEKATALVNKTIPDSPTNPIPPLDKPFKKDWGKLLDHLKNRIGTLPTVSEGDQILKEKYLGIHTLLTLIKDAWRNPTTHVRRKYSPDEAKEIWDALKPFCKRIAELLPN